MNEFVKKIIARDGSREEIICDAFEVNKVMEYGEIEDFKDKSIICIKFQFSDNPDFVDAEDTSWYINNIYAEKFIKPIVVDDEIEGHQYAPFVLENDVYSIYSEFIPEVLLFEEPKEYDLFKAFDSFYSEHMGDFDKYSIEDLLNMFEDYLKDYTRL